MKNANTNQANQVAQANQAHQTGVQMKEALIQARNEWEARNEEQKAKFEAQHAVFRTKMKEVLETVEQQILKSIGETKLNLDVKAESGYRSTLKVRISNEQDRNETNALRWNWDASIDENGSLKFESNSWSGLSVTTPEQARSLKETANALEILMGLDWAKMLNVELPKWEDYVTEKSSIGTRPNFEADIRAAEVAELIGTNKLIKGTQANGHGHGITWFLIISESAKQYKVATISDYNTKAERLAECGKTLEEVVEQAKKWPTGVTKEKFMNCIGKTLETMSF